MRRVGAFVACVGLAAAVAGCTDYDYIRNGIGTHLSTKDLAAATQIQDAYVGEICRQAGLRTIEQPLPDGAVALACDELGMRSGDWALFVQAGMNDIDRRCDAYLAWLDDKRRSSEPLLKEIGKLGAETIAILSAVNAGVKSITIVGIAFGLGAETFTNINARLSGLEQSTIQSTVLGNQHDFRVNIAGAEIPNRPFAIYLLRGYLRICTPFSIETSINNTVTVYHRAPDALTRTDPLFTDIITDPTKRFSIPKKKTGSGPEILDRNEASIPASRIVQIQKSLCVTPVDGKLGPAGSKTRIAIGDYLEGLGKKRSEKISLFVDDQLEKAITKVPDCAAAGLTTAKQVGQRAKGT